MGKDNIRSIGEIKMSAGVESLTIKGFKGFGNEITIDFTRRAKNLVIYGENGSGKTSIMEALKLLFDSSKDKIELDKYKNIFSKGSIEIKIETSDELKKKVKEDFSNRGIISKKSKITQLDFIISSNPRAVDIRIAGNEYFENENINLIRDEIKRNYLEAISKSTTILSYRKLMKIYDIKTDEDFYDLFVRNIMAYYLIPPRKEKTLIQELEELEKLKKESPRAKKRIEEKENAIKTEINKIFSEIKDKWNEYIKTLTGDDIEVECSIEQLGSLKFEIKWNGKDMSNIMNYLNEGRLNAVALGLFLAYYKKFNASPYKLLLLDDVVIGLDMSLRLPLLEILQKDFDDEYQIIMTTFDENWFNLMDNYNYLDHSKWEFKRLFIKFTDNNGFPFIIAIGSSDYLKKAREYYEKGDIPAAALYARLEFESLVTNYAEKKNLEIRFKRKISEIPINVIWTKVKQSLQRAKTLCKRVDTYKSILLNPSVHYDQRPKYRNEVKYAIGVVSRLKEKINRELK